MSSMSGNKMSLNEFKRLREKSFQIQLSKTAVVKPIFIHVFGSKEEAR